MAPSMDEYPNKVPVYHAVNVTTVAHHAINIKIIPNMI